MSRIPADLKLLLRLYGVASEYRDAWGETRCVPPQVLSEVLGCLGIPSDTVQERKHALSQLRKEIAARVLQPIIIWQATKVVHQTVVTIPARLTASSDRPLLLKCSLRPIDGLSDDTDQGRPILTWEFSPSRESLVRERVLGRERLRRYHLRYRGELTPGYYCLELFRIPDGSFLGRATVIVAPDGCFLPRDEKPCWGVSAQLYSLWDNAEQSIGDFSCLERLLTGAVGSGASFVGLNPLHAIPLSGNQTWSPYAPLSRELLNILYVSPPRAPEWQGLSETEKDEYLCGSDTVGLVDYALAAQKKIRVFQLMFEVFERNHLSYHTMRAQEYREFLQGNSALLDCYRNTEEEKLLRAEVFGYAQWVAHQQLSEIAASCMTADPEERPLGLYLDLALGGTANSLEVQLEPALYATRLSMGAPPDELNLKGQSWGLVPHVPWRLREQGYAPYIRVLRKAMEFAGAIRIDHAMSLMRVYCVPVAHEDSMREGAYVYSRVSELLAIIALESQKSRCIVIGEDLGTVPERFRQLMKQHRMLSYKILWFMQDAEGFIQPAHYEHLSMASPTTHDLPTVAGFLAGDDNELRLKLKLFPRTEMFDEYIERREKDVALLLELLARCQLCPDDVGDVSQLVDALLLMLAGSGSLLYAVSLEDILALREQLNVPGTTTEYPNWRERLPLSVSNLLESSRWQRLTGAFRLNVCRKRGIQR